jgi:hypothetical protein
VASKSLVKWLKMLWENWGMRVCGMSYVVCYLMPLSPAAGEFTFHFIGQGEGELQACRTI